MCNKENSLAPPVPLNASTSADKSRIQNLGIIYGPSLIMKTANRRVVAQGFHHGALSHTAEQPGSINHRCAPDPSSHKSLFLDKYTITGLKANSQ